MATLLSRLTGRVRTLRPGSNNPYAVPWRNVSRYEPHFSAAATEQGIDALLLAAVAMVESESNHYEPDGKRILVRRGDGTDDHPAIGIMQVKPFYWQSLLPDADPGTVAGNIRLGAAVLALGLRQHGAWQAAIAALYFPSNDPARGTTQGGYLATVASLMAEMRNQTRPAPPRADPEPVNVHDPLAVIFGGVPTRIEYGFLADVGLNYYAYGVGHGTTRPTQHTGDDVLVPDETLLYAPAPGIVTCVGWRGNPTYGQGCGYFEDQDGGGIGNISLLLDSGHKVVFGHSSSAAVAVGERVAAGQRIGRSGGMNGPHTHLEVAIDRGGYWLVDPQPALREAMRGVRPSPPETVYAARVPIPQPSEFDVSATVYATTNGVKVLQRADLNAPEVAPPLRKDEDFEAVYQVLGEDGRLYWVSTRGARVPVEGTRSPEWESAQRR